MKRVAILGSTGSIGTQTLDVIAQHPDRLQVVALAAGSDSVALSTQSQSLGGVKTALFNTPKDGDPRDAEVGLNAVEDLITDEDVDLVVVSVAGVIGLRPTLAAIRAGKQVALASKEVLVAAGEIVMPLLAKHHTTMTPIDSEHSAIFQCLQGYEAHQIEQLILTASGGPFRGKKRHELEQISVQQALNHPTWSMGGKITVDSATLMNKALEMIEAKWLFGVSMDQVRVVVHPQSVVHSLVKFHDGSALGQLGWPDMRIPIQYALLYPERKGNSLRTWDPTETPTLTFENLDEETFLGPALGREAERRGGTTACAFNAANEEAVAMFLRQEIGFLDIYRVVEKVLQSEWPKDATFENLVATDNESRVKARTLTSPTQFHV
jgi:1-deoxy-D-xylulose-5-phosphate reductoisomerase